MNVHLAVLGTTRQSGDELFRVKQPVGIKGAFQGVEKVELFARKLHAHLVDLLDTYAMLASYRATHLHAKFQNGGAELLGALHLVDLVGVEQNKRMQIPVACMKDIGATQAELVFHLFDGAKHPAQVAPRYRAIHTVVVRRYPPCRRKGILASRPEQQALV